MSLKSKFVSVFASAVVLGSVAVVASAQDQSPAPNAGTEKTEKHGRGGFGRRGGEGRGMRGGKFGGMRAGKFGGMHGLRGIELTDAQKAQVKQIHEANRPDSSAMGEMKAIQQARRSGTITEAQKARVKELRDQMRTRGESVHAQVLAILTPEQRQQLETRKAERRTKMQERRELRQQRRKTASPADKSNDN